MRVHGGQRGAAWRTDYWLPAQNKAPRRKPPGRQARATGVLDPVAPAVVTAARSRYGVTVTRSRANLALSGARVTPASSSRRECGNGRSGDG